MFVYVMIFTLQWVPTIPVYTIGLLGVDNTATNVIIATMSHLGSSLNLLHYIHQEDVICLGRWIRKWSMTTNTYSEGSQISPPRRPMSTSERPFSSRLCQSFELTSQEQ